MKLSNKPQTIDGNNWYYEEARNIELIHRVYDGNGAFLFTDHIKIPWRKVFASVRRYREDSHE